MFRIALCDDSEIDTKETHKLIEEYRLSHCYDFEVEYYSLPEKLLQNCEEGRRYDAYILDIVMPQMGGIELGEKIRSMNTLVPIIYTTSSEEFALDAFSVQAMRYLLKPIQMLDLTKAMDYLFYVSGTTTNKFTVNCVDGMEQILFSEIESIEISSRRLEISLTDGGQLISKCIRDSFEISTRELVEKGPFIQPHKSFLVNLACIKKLSLTEVIMDSGKIIPISKSNSGTVKSKYLKYLAVEGRRG